MAGARCVVQTLWKVGDSSASALMDSFYYEMLGGSSVEAALREAASRCSHTPKIEARDAAFFCVGVPGVKLDVAVLPQIIRGLVGLRWHSSTLCSGVCAVGGGGARVLWEGEL